jgi:integrase
LHARLSRGPGPATVNAYVSALRSFTRWLVRDRRAGDNPLAGLSGVSTAGDVRHDRRALPPDELGTVLQAALASGTSFRGLSGRDRHFLYLTACGTGFRAGELASLTPESFDLETTPPTATVPAGYTKNKRLAVQPLPAEVAEALRGYLCDRPAGRPVWGGAWAHDRVAAQMLRIDLKAAGIPYEVEGPDGPLYADFHALRHSYVALLDRAGLTLKQAMQLARHSDPRLTMAVYGRAQLHDLGAAVEGLPPLLPGTPRPDAAARAAAGTAGGTAGGPAGESLRPACAAGEAGGVVLRLAETGGPGVAPACQSQNAREKTAFEGDCERLTPGEGAGPGGARTGTGLSI